MTNKKDRKDHGIVITSDPGIIDCQPKQLASFKEYFDKRIELNFQNEDGVDRINFIALSHIPNNPSTNIHYSSIDGSIESLGSGKPARPIPFHAD